MARTKMFLTGLLVLCLCGPSLAKAAQEDQEDLRATVEALKQRLQDQDRRIAELEAKLATTTPASQEAQEEQIRQVVRQMRDDAKDSFTGPSWLEDLEFFGDLRLRYEAQCFDWNRSGGSSKKNRNRARFRVRAGVTKTWLDDQLEATFRLATGSDEHPTSTNQSMDSSFTKKTVWIDLAYARYSPKAVKGLKLVGGKMKTPWMTNSTFMDSDVNPEGFWGEYTFAKMGIIEPFLGAGYFILEESENGSDATLGVYQVGANFDVTKDVVYTIAGVYQDYQDYADTAVSARGNDSPLRRIPDFRVIGVNNRLAFPLLGRKAVLLADLAHNCGEGDATAKYTGQDNAFAAGIEWGKNKKKGDWSLKYRYAYVEANALPGYFVDSDFGYANRQGHIIGGAYNLLDDLTIGATVLMTEPVFSPTTSANSSDEDMTTTLMVDLLWKF